MHLQLVDCQHADILFPDRFYRNMGRSLRRRHPPSGNLRLPTIQVQGDDVDTDYRVLGSLDACPRYQPPSRWISQRDASHSVDERGLRGVDLQLFLRLLHRHRSRLPHRLAHSESSSNPRLGGNQ